MSISGKEITDFIPISEIEINNFTVFNELKIYFCDGINIFIGENGTGKTHLLKILYAFCKCDQRTKHKSFDLNLTDCFRTDDVKNLVRRVNSENVYPSGISVTNTSNIVKYWILNGSNISFSITEEKQSIPAIYIPAKDMLTHGGLEKDYIERNLPFDITYIDILNKAGISTIKKLPEYKYAILNIIARIIDGKVLYKNDRYYTKKSDGTIIDFSVEAEGFKKLGLIYRLIETGHLNDGSVLIWDEPEANLNPKIIPIVVEILLELSRHGVQVFLATHEYNLLKNFSIKKKLEDEVAFFSLYKSTQGILCERDEDYSLLEHNSIIEANNKLLDDEIEKVL